MRAGRNTSGFALVAALWLVVLLTVVAVGLSYTNRQAIRSMGALVGGTQARYLAEGGVQLILMSLLARESKDRLLGDGETFPVDLPGGLVNVRVSDESGKIDINTAPAELIARLFNTFDIPEEQASALADALVDFRDEDSLSQLNGAEDEDYLNEGLPWEAKDDLFTSLEELQRVFGMQPWIFQAMLPYVTIHSRQKGVNPEVAPLQVLLALSDESPNALLEYVEQRRESHRDGLALPPAPVIARKFASRSRGVTYTLAAMAQTELGKRASITTTVRLRRSRNRLAIETLDWRPYRVLPPVSLEKVDVR